MPTFRYTEISDDRQVSTSVWDKSSYIWLNNDFERISIKIPKTSEWHSQINTNAFLPPTVMIILDTPLVPIITQIGSEYETYCNYMRFNSDSAIAYAVGTTRAGSASATLGSILFETGVYDSYAGTGSNRPNLTKYASGGICYFFACPPNPNTPPPEGGTLDGFQLMFSGLQYLEDGLISTSSTTPAGRIEFERADNFPSGSSGLSLTEEPKYSTPSGGNDPYNPGGNSGQGGGTGNFDNTTVPVDIPGLPSLSASDTGFISLYNPSISQLNSLASFMWSDLFDLDTFKKNFC